MLSNPPATIVSAIKIVLKSAQRGLTADEIYDAILEKKYYHFKAIDPKSVVRSMVRRHCINLDFATASPIKYFRVGSDDKYYLESEKGVHAKPTQTINNKSEAEKLPEEIIKTAHQDHLTNVRRDLMQRILESHPSFFERLVLELLGKMGYGASDPKRLKHTGGPGDGGIDGTIYEDKLGLEKIHIQTKRYRPDRKVKPSEIRDFLGSLNKVRKGVFITTSSYALQSIKFAETHEKSVVLIDGEELCSMMITYGIGVDALTNYMIYRVDSDYFPSIE